MVVPTLSALEPSRKLDVQDPSLSGEDIVCLALRPWDGPWKASQQIMSRIALSNRVFYIGPPSSLRTGINGIRRGVPRPPILEEVARNLFVYREPRLLTRSRASWVFNFLTAQLRMLQAVRLARFLGFTTPILWVFDPLLGPAGGSFRPKFVIYHVVDDYVEYFSRHAERVRAIVTHRQEEILRRADIVFAVSPPLYARCRMRNPNSVLVPNGVDFERFQRVIAAAEPPADVRPIPRPIIGYVGVLQSTMNFPLLHQLAMERPEWSLLLVGPVELGRERPGFEQLLRYPNVHYLGSKSRDDVPRYIQSCDVCIMPDDERTDGDVLKLYEYLACGRPVVSWENGTAKRFAPLVRIARDVPTFIEGVAASLAEDQEASRARIAAASEHTWERRVAVLGEAVVQHLSKTRHSTRTTPGEMAGGAAL